MKLPTLRLPTPTPVQLLVVAVIFLSLDILILYRALEADRERVSQIETKLKGLAA